MKKGVDKTKKRWYNIEVACESEPNLEKTLKNFFKKV